ncbi:hypothetical protein BJ742DRAFT_807044 [Cladochytrium replicatum]|nr:hypothetical protein BJ742DRAFT_807044 [Cladochytrium replicatum]
MLAFVQAKLDDKNRSSELIQQMNPSDFALSQYDPHHPSVSLGWPIQPRNWHHPSSTTQISPTATVPFPGYVFPTQQNFDNMRSMCGGMMPQNGFSQNGNSTQNSRYEVAGQEGCDQHWLTLRADSRSTRKLSKAEEIAAAAEAASVTLEASGCLRSTSMISGMDTSSSQNLGHHYSSIHGSAPSSQVLGSHLFPNRHGDRLYGSFPTQMNGPLRFPLWQPNSFDADEDITQRLGMAVSNTRGFVSALSTPFDCFKHAATMNDANGWRLIGPAANGTNGRMVSSIDDIRIIQRSEESTASSSVAPNKDKRFGRSRSPSIQQNDNKRQDDEDESSRWLAGLYIERSRRDNNQRRRNQDEIQQQTKAPSKFGDSNKRGRSPSGVARLSLRDQSKHGKARGNPDECNQSKYEMSDAAGSPAPRKRVRSNTSMSSKMTLEERLKKPLAHWNSYRPTGDRRRQDTERKSDRDESGGREGDRRGSGGAEVERRWNCYRPQRRSTLVSSGDMESAKEKRESSLTRYNSDQIGRNSYRPKEDLSRASSSSLTLRGSDRTSTPEKMKANNSQELSESLSKPIIDQTALLKLASLSAPLTTLTDAITTLEKLAAFPPVPETKTRQETTANIDVSTAAAAAAALIAFAGSLKAAAGQDI